MIDFDLFQVTGKSWKGVPFCAGAILRNGRFGKAAPIIQFSLAGKSLSEAKRKYSQYGWQFVHVSYWKGE